jgi:predicted nucleic acid-binding protein
MPASPKPDCVLDTSAWVALFNDEPAAAALPAAQGEGRTVTTPIVLAEVAALEALGRLRGASLVDDVERRARLEPLTREDAIEGARTYARLRKAGRTKVGLADALIYATARRVGATLITLDTDLEGEPDVTVLPQKRSPK